MRPISVCICMLHQRMNMGLGDDGGLGIGERFRASRELSDRNSNSYWLILYLRLRGLLSVYLGSDAQKLFVQAAHNRAGLDHGTRGWHTTNRGGLGNYSYKRRITA